MTKIGINGFGRIGRFVFRASTKRDDIEVVAINDLLPVDYMAYMLKYDTMHGQFDGTVDYDLEKSLLIVNGKNIRVTACKNPAEIAWGAVGAEYVVESTGLFLTKEKAQAHIEAGAKYVVMSHPQRTTPPCSFAVLTMTPTLVSSSFPTLLAQPTVLPPSPRSSTTSLVSPTVS